jgi:hypothetical protein
MSNDHSLNLSDAYSDTAVQAFGKALRAALTFDQDYASLIDFENAETPAAFNEAVEKFLRRNYNKPVRPTAADLERLMSLARNPEDVRTLRSAIISYGLVRWDKKEEAD